jgi:hypothetical protein
MSKKLKIMFSITIGITGVAVEGDEVREVGF